MNTIKSFEAYNVSENFSFSGFVVKYDPDYEKNVHDHCYNIAMNDLGISEKSFDTTERLEGYIESILSEHFLEYKTITTNCSQRSMRCQYSAEVVYHTLLQGILRAKNELAWFNGGFQK